MPRILGILFAMFVSLFALDVFGQGAGLWQEILGLLIHLVPTYLIILALVIAWRWEWVGTILFGGLGVFYIVLTWEQFSWVAAALISGPAFLVGGLFLLDWTCGLRRQPPQGAS